MYRRGHFPRAPPRRTVTGSWHSVTNDCWQYRSHVTTGIDRRLTHKHFNSWQTLGVSAICGYDLSRALKSCRKTSVFNARQP